MGAAAFGDDAENAAVGGAMVVVAFARGVAGEQGKVKVSTALSIESSG